MRDPDYTTVSTSTLMFLLKHWEAENKRKPTRRNMRKIQKIRAALAQPQKGK